MDGGGYWHGDGLSHYPPNNSQPEPTTLRKRLQENETCAEIATSMPDMLTGMTGMSPTSPSDQSMLQMQQMAYGYTMDGYVQQQAWQGPLVTDHSDRRESMQWDWADAAATQQAIEQPLVPDGSAYGMVSMNMDQNQMYANPYEISQERVSSGKDGKGKRKQKKANEGAQASTVKRGRPFKTRSPDSTRSTAKSTSIATSSSKTSPNSTMSPVSIESGRAAGGRRHRRRSTKMEVDRDNNNGAEGGQNGASGSTQVQREQNRAAATKCRAKTKAATNKLEEDERHASEQRAYLAAVADRLRNEVLFLKSELLRHSDCDCVLIQQYLARMAKLISEGSNDAPRLPTGLHMTEEEMSMLIADGVDGAEDDDDDDE